MKVDTRTALVFVALGVLASGAGAQILSLDYSNDISWKVGSALEGRAGVVRQTPPASAAAVGLGTLPANANLVAFTVGPDGAPLFVLDTTVDLPGSVHAGPRDVVRYAGGVYSVVFSGAAAGIPAGTSIDGLAFRHTAAKDYFVFSLDVTAKLGGSLTATPRDVVVWDGTNWSKPFDGAAAGVPSNLMIDALSVDGFAPTGLVFYLSFDGSGKLGTVNFDDEDVMAWDGSAWSLAFDGSTQADTTFAAGDLDALQVRTPNIFRDGFESGDTTQWSAATS